MRIFFARKNWNMIGSNQALENKDIRYHRDIRGKRGCFLYEVRC